MISAIIAPAADAASLANAASFANAASLANAASFANAASLAATLSSLTAAALDGFVREVIVCGADLSPEAREVAEESGATIHMGDLAEAIRGARQPWLLILPAGARLQISWEPAARAHISRRPDLAGWFRLNYAADGLGARLAEAWANSLAGLGRRRAEHGVLVAARCWSATDGRGLGYRPIEARVLVGGVGGAQA